MESIQFLKPFRIYISVFILILSINIGGCKKFLDEKPNQKLATPKSIEEAQALLDDYIDMNSQCPNICAMSDDDFYLAESYFNSMDVNGRNIYTWEREVYPDEAWKTMYKVVLHANISLETLDKIEKTVYNESAYDNVYGSALFFRAFAFNQLLQVYAGPYNAGSATIENGIALRLSSDIAIVTNRSSMASCYERVIKDVKQALFYLPRIQSIVSRPSKAAAYSLLSDIYLNMENYNQAGLYADSALQLHNTLLNYNTFDTTLARPFTRFNPEVIFSSCTAGAASLATAIQKVDTTLYGMYQISDLRKPLFFRNIAEKEYGFKGNYQNSTGGILFNGYAVDEMMLIRAECSARNNEIMKAMNDVNALLLTRYKTGTFIPYTATTSIEALNIVLQERRKELVGRAKRWVDLRRLNKNNLHSKTLRRNVNGSIVTLEPASKRYTYYLPQQVVQMTGVEQNQR